MSEIFKPRRHLFDAMNEHLFYAVLPPSRIAKYVFGRAIATRQKYGFHGRLISANRLHVSLCGVGPYDFELLGAARYVGSQVKMGSFEVSFDRALSFKKDDACPFVLTGEKGRPKLTELARQLSAAWGKRFSSFTPHMTLIWDQQKVESHEIQQPVSWTVSEFALVRSFVGQSRYEILERWPLDWPGSTSA